MVPSLGIVFVKVHLFGDFGISFILIVVRAESKATVWFWFLIVNEKLMVSLMVEKSLFV